MKKPQWMTLGAGVLLVAVIFIFARTVPPKKTVEPGAAMAAEAMPGELTTDTILLIAKRQLSPEQVSHVTSLENSISRGAVKSQQLEVYHQLAHFWGDSLGFFAPYAWYQAESARLENSEKSLTFAAHLLLRSLEDDAGENAGLSKWKAIQAKDLFERALKINPDNDSSKVGLGSCYLFGNISANPMEGILKIREVVEKDSTNLYAQMTLVKGSLVSGQVDKAISRLQSISRMDPSNVEAILLLADVYERTGDKKTAIEWYRKSLSYIKRADVRTEIEKRINDLTK